MISITEKELCCGCGACSQKCPVHCIEMVEDREGFVYPKCNKNDCINCGRCEAVCPMLNKSTSEDKLIGCYVCYSYDDTVRANSSSGGVFAQIAATVLEDNGVVYGAAFDSDYLVHHIRIDKQNQLADIQKSKYLQSRIEDTYTSAEADLLCGRWVLFSGTPCQIEGLKYFLGREYSRLLTIDILCHGVPSPMIWKLYLDLIGKQSNRSVGSVDFRNKEYGWKNYSLRINYDSNTYYTALHNRDTFMSLFLSDVILRPCCYKCKFKGLSRVSDVTLGDAWGVNKILPEMDDDKGTSLVLVHSFRGTELFEKLKKEIQVSNIEIDRILPPKSDSRISVRQHSKRKEFFERVWKDESKAFKWWDRYRKRKRYKDRLIGKIQLILSQSAGL